jgi:predicted O-linked N-acetylglucosamine transferase (SPINDLY family)
MSLDLAMTHYEAGNRAAAKAGAEAFLKISPNNGDALNLLAIISQDEGRQADAEILARQAVALAPSNPVYLNTLGNGLLAQGRSAEAVTVLEQAHQALPEQADILFNLGNAQRQAGLLDAAVESFRRTTELRPGHIGAFNNLALILKSIGDVESAATVLIEAVAHAPKSAELRFNLGNALHAAGRLPAAEAAYRKAIELDPRHAEAHANLGAVLAEAGFREKAQAAFQAAIVVNPDTISAYMGLAELAGDDATDGIERRRALLAVRPDLAPIRSSLLMCLHYVPGISKDRILEEHKAFGALAKRKEAPVFSRMHDFTPARSLKVGFVSGDFRFHAMLFFALPVIEGRDKSAFEIFLYSTTLKTDPYTPDFQAAADHWRDVRTLSADDLARLIVRDGIDILIDLSGHGPHNRLPAFALKPAPLQVAWGDYVDTRGLDTIDILLGDAVHTPPGEARYFTERVVRFAPDYVAYRPPSYAPSVADAPCIANGYITFGTFSEVTKVGPAAVAQWAAVLKAIPSSKFMLNGFLFADGARQGRIVSMFVEAGIAAERLIFKDGALHGAFLAQYAEVDIILDTAPYSGGLTTCEALLMGVPVLTVMGDRFCGRHAAAHVMNGGYPDGVVATVPDLVKKAEALAGDPQGLRKLRLTLRESLMASPLCDVTGFSKDFYGTLRKEWIALCAQRATVGFSPPSS